MNASDLTSRAMFLKPEIIRDPDGGLIQDYLPQFDCAAHVLFLRGTETVMAARLQSKSPVIITIRDCADARLITSEWRVEISGRTYDIKEDPRPDGAMRAMLAEA